MLDVCISQKYSKPCQWLQKCMNSSDTHLKYKMLSTCQKGSSTLNQRTSKGLKRKQMPCHNKKPNKLASKDFI